MEESKDSKFRTVFEKSPNLGAEDFLNFDLGYRFGVVSICVMS